MFSIRPDTDGYLRSICRFGSPGSVVTQIIFPCTPRKAARYTPHGWARQPPNHVVALLRRKSANKGFAPFEVKIVVNLFSVFRCLRPWGPAFRNCQAFVCEIDTRSARATRFTPTVLPSRVMHDDLAGWFLFLDRARPCCRLPSQRGVVEISPIFFMVLEIAPVCSRPVDRLRARCTWCCPSGAYFTRKSPTNLFVKKTLS